MLEDSQIAARAVAAARQNFGPQHVVRAIVEPWYDSEGNDALRVTVVVTPDTEMVGDAGADTLLDFHARLRRDGEGRFTVLHYVTEDELAKSGDTES